MTQIPIIPDFGAGANFGAAFGGGLGELLGTLAQRKAQRLQQSQQARGLEALGITPDKASAIAQLDPKTQQEVVKQIMLQPQNEAFAQAFSAILGVPASYPTSSQQQPTTTLDLAAQQFAPLQDQQLQQQQNKLAANLSSLAPSTFPTPQATQQPSMAALARLNPQQAMQLGNLLMQQQGKQQQQQMAEKKLEQQERFHKEKLSAKEQETSDKETLPYYRDILKNAKSVRDSDMRLNRIEEITKKDMAKGTLTNRFGILMNEFLREKHKILGTEVGGIDFSSLMSGDTQELQKLSADFARGAASALRTNKLTNAELDLFMKSVPTLLQSNEGRIRVITNMRIMNDMTKLEKDTMDKIIKENGGKRPRDLEAQVDERMGPKLDELSKKFTTAADDAVANAQQWVSSVREKEKKKPILPKVAKNIEALPQHNSLLGKALSGIMG